MNPRQQLALLRIVQTISWIFGIAIMVPVMSGPHGTLTFSEALPILIGIVVIFLPRAILGMALPARCSMCGDRMPVEVKHDVPGHSQAGSERGHVRAFRWKCDSCGRIEDVPATWFDRLIMPRFTTSPDTGGTSRDGE